MVRVAFSHYEMQQNATLTLDIRIGQPAIIEVDVRIKCTPVLYIVYYASAVNEFVHYVGVC